MAAYPTADWMKYISDEKLLSEFSIPGTHDTMTYLSSNIWVQTQDLSLFDQLQAGIRSIDIRVLPVEQSDGTYLFSLVHGPIQLGAEFGRAVLDLCIPWLDQNPTECIILRIQPQGDYSSSRIEPTFEWYLEGRNPARFYLDNTIPTLHNARGRLVLLRVGGFTPGRGIDATDMPSPGSVESKLNNANHDILFFENYYEMGTEGNNLPYIRAAIVSATNQAAGISGTYPKNCWFITNAAGSGSAYTPKSCALETWGLNISTRDQMNTIMTSPSHKPPVNMGTISFDYPNETSGLIDAFMRSNNIPEI
jgi:hypothetical protein